MYVQVLFDAINTWYNIMTDRCDCAVIGSDGCMDGKPGALAPNTISNAQNLAPNDDIFASYCIN